MDKLKKNMIFYIVLLADFYVIPCLIKDTGSGMIVMLMIVPLVCLVTSIFSLFVYFDCTYYAYSIYIYFL